MSEMMKRMELQSAEFDAADAFAKALRAHNNVAVVDDDYPEVRHTYESALRAFFQACANNGRTFPAKEDSVAPKRELHIAWNEARTVGVICEDRQMVYELRKGANNSLGIVTGEFCEAWAEMTADDNCTIEDVRL